MDNHRLFEYINEEFSKLNPFIARENKAKQTLSQVTLSSLAKQESTRPATDLQMAAFANNFKPDATTTVDVLFYYEYCCWRSNQAVDEATGPLMAQALLKPQAELKAAAMFSQDSVWALGVQIKGSEDTLMKIKAKAKELNVDSFINEGIDVQLALLDLVQHEDGMSANAVQARANAITKIDNYHTLKMNRDSIRKMNDTLANPEVQVLGTRTHTGGRRGVGLAPAPPGSAHLQQYKQAAHRFRVVQNTTPVTQRPIGQPISGPSNATYYPPSQQGNTAAARSLGFAGNQNAAFGAGAAGGPAGAANGQGVPPPARYCQPGTLMECGYVTCDQCQGGDFLRCTGNAVRCTPAAPCHWDLCPLQCKKRGV